MYITIFVTLFRSRGRVQEANHGLFRRFRDSKFYIAILIISTFTVFVLVSDICLTFIGRYLGLFPSTLIGARFLCLAISDIADGIIYIFLNRKVRGYVKKKALKLKRRCHQMEWPCVQDTLGVVLVCCRRSAIKKNQIAPEEDDIIETRESGSNQNQQSSSEHTENIEVHEVQVSHQA